MEPKPHPEDVAQICKRGHIIVASLKTSPQLRKSFCEKCGAVAINECQTCDWPIAGEGDAQFGGGPFRLPKFCEGCGDPFPWTKTALLAAKEYTEDLNELSAEEKTVLKATFDDLMSDTARTPLAANRFKTFVSKIGAVEGDVLKSILESVITQAAKKSMDL
jgi:hypothetical protein